MRTLFVVMMLMLGLVVVPVHQAGAIVGGEFAQEYSWNVAFVADPSVAPGTPVDQRVICSGTLVASGWVLTAAHCPLPSATTQVVIGRDDLAQADGQKRRIVEHVKHPYHVSQPGEDAWDLELVRLDEPVTLDPMEIAGPGEAVHWGEDTLVRTYGYGQFGPDTYPSRYARRGQFRIDELLANHHQMIVSAGGRSFCNADSGGGVIASTPGGPRLVGVAIATTGACDLGAPQYVSKVGHRSSLQNSPLWYWSNCILQGNTPVECEDAFAP